MFWFRKILLAFGKKRKEKEKRKKIDAVYAQNNILSFMFTSEVSRRM